MASTCGPVKSGPIETLTVSPCFQAVALPWAGGVWQSVCAAPRRQHDECRGRQFWPMAKVLGYYNYRNIPPGADVNIELSAGGCVCWRLEQSAGLRCESQRCGVRIVR